MPGPGVSRGLALMGHCLGGVKTPPYGAKDKRAVPARWRAGHARQAAVCGQASVGGGVHDAPPCRQLFAGNA